MPGIEKPGDLPLRSEFEQLVDRFEAAWQSGEPPAIEDYLPADATQQKAILVELVHVDLERRLTRDDSAKVEQYLERYPKLLEDHAAVVELIAAEYRLRMRRDPGLTAQEFANRFPQYRDELPRQLENPPQPWRRFPVHLNCPHCRNPIEIVAHGPGEEVLCPSCGSSFRLDPDRTQSWAKDKLPTLGKFELIEAVGRGAFGTVYRARDTQLQRIVAVKVPRSGQLATDEDEDRFVREARNVAQLQHPGIVPVYEVGRSETFPYIVSEFVEGVTLTDALSARRFGFREAAQLVARVAEALEHAHAQGVVHRDLKPSNIMLTLDGTPRVMDFGLAKRDAGEVTVTVEGQVLGTPAYMSPEQASGQAHHVDGRSDVYSLGVILFELLTGELPFRGNQRMLLHNVVHNEPRSPRSLNDRVPRDLETICLKAMAKEPSRRYQTAQALADDLGRWLKSEPILARPVGRAERSWRWCRRNPVVASLSAAVTLALTVGMGASTYFAVLANAGARAAEVNLDEATRQRERAETGFREARQASQVAEARARTSNSVSQFLIGMFEEPTPYHLFTMRVGNVSTSSRALLNRGAQQLAEQLEDEPVLKARLLAAIGRAHFGTGNLLAAGELLEQALEIRRGALAANDPEIAQCMQDLGTVYSMVGRIAEAEELLRANLKLRLQAGGESDDKTVEAKAQLALVLGLATCERDTAEKLWRQVVDVRRRTLEPNDPGLGEALMGLGGVLLWSQKGSTVETFRRGAEAVALLNEAIRILTANDSTREIGLAIAAFQRAVMVATIGNRASALGLLKEAHERAKKSLGVDHPMTVFFLMQHGMYLSANGHDQEARAAYEELFDIYQDHGVLFTFPHMEKSATSAFHGLLEEAGELDKFEHILQRIWDKQKQIGNFRSRNGIMILTQLIFHLKQQQKNAEAERLLDEYLACSHALDEASRLLDGERIFSLAQALAALGRTDAAVQAINKCVAVLQYEHRHDARTAVVYNNRIGDLLLTLGKFSEAEAHLREVIPMAQAEGPPAAPDTAVPNLHLAKAIAAQDRPDEARKIFKEAFGLARNCVAHDKAHLSEFLWIAIESSRFLAQHGDLRGAESMLDEALETGRSVGGAQGRNNEWVLATMLARGRIHAQQGQTSQARAMFDEIIRATGSVAAHDSRADTLQSAREELAKLP